MGAIRWDDTLETGVELMDEQHRRLVEIYNKLDEASMRGRAHKQMDEILADLIGYTDHHFSAEEALMEEAGYPDLAIHRSEHRQLIEKVRRFRRKLDLGMERINRPVMKFLNYWLTHHIRGSDNTFARYAAEAAADDAAPENASA